jgi:hypothetical protein
MTTARLTALPSSHTDGCLLASSGMTPGTHAWCLVVTHVTQPLVAGHRRRTSNACGVKHRPTVRGTRSGRHRPDTLRHACLATSTVRSASWRLQVFRSSSWSSSNRPRVPVVTYAAPTRCTPKHQSPQGGGVVASAHNGNTGIIIWQPWLQRHPSQGQRHSSHATLSPFAAVTRSACTIQLRNRRHSTV